MDAAKPKHRYVVLDSLRGVCACMVVLLHLSTPGYISAAPVVKNGFLFVDFFFVLSGFVIGSSYGSRIAEGFPIHRFMWLRLGRIYPLHFVMLMAFLVFEIVFALFMHDMAYRRPFEGGFAPSILGYSLLLVQIFFGPDATPWNGPSWSIAAEIWAYLIFAVLLRYAFRWIVPISLLIAVAAPVILFHLTDRYLAVFHDGALLRCLFGFSLGIIGWRCTDWVQSIQLGKLGDNLLELVVVVATIWLVSEAGAGPLSLAAPFLFFIAVMTFSRERGAISRLLKCAPFVLVGALSYSIYMVHAFFEYRFINGLSLLKKLTGLNLTNSSGEHTTVGGVPLFGDLMSITFLAFVIGVAYLTYNWIELPGQRKAREFMQKRTSAPQPAAP